MCHARGQLKCYIKLTVTWKTTKADHVVERTALPDHLIREAQGKLAFEDKQPRVRETSAVVVLTWQLGSGLSLATGSCLQCMHYIHIRLIPGIKLGMRLGTLGMSHLGCHGTGF